MLHFCKTKFVVGNLFPVQRYRKRVLCTLLLPQFTVKYFDNYYLVHFNSNCLVYTNITIGLCMTDIPSLKFKIYTSSLIQAFKIISNVCNDSSLTLPYAGVLFYLLEVQVCSEMCKKYFSE